jgi:glutathione reductase (NADPH)
LSDTSGWFDARRTNLKHALAKTIVDKKTGRIVGAHLLGNRADDLINMFALAVEAGITVDQWKTPVYTFPTTSDDTRYLF